MPREPSTEDNLNAFGVSQYKRAVKMRDPIKLIRPSQYESRRGLTFHRSQEMMLLELTGRARRQFGNSPAAAIHSFCNNSNIVPVHRICHPRDMMVPSVAKFQQKPHSGMPVLADLVIRLSLPDPTADKAARNPKCAWTATKVDASYSISGNIE